MCHLAKSDVKIKKVRNQANNDDQMNTRGSTVAARYWSVQNYYSSELKQHSLDSYPNNSTTPLHRLQHKFVWRQKQSILPHHRLCTFLTIKFVYCSKKGKEILLLFWILFLYFYALFHLDVQFNTILFSWFPNFLFY